MIGGNLRYQDCGNPITPQSGTELQDDNLPSKRGVYQRPHPELGIEWMELAACSSDPQSH